MFLLTETLLPTDNDINIHGYKFFSRARRERKGGGVGILIRDDIKNLITPHISDRPIEMIWASIRRKNDRPLFVGCYYGRQETRCSKEEINEEMNLLSEEIEEFQKEGDTIIFMDGNGKIGLLGEEKSRNGKMLEQVFLEYNLAVMNRDPRCKGKITRACTTNNDEKSAIDFVVAEESIASILKSMVIDEKGTLKLSGQKHSDHNTIIIELEIKNTKTAKPPPKTKWRINAPECDWSKFRHELSKLEPETSNIFNSHNLTIDQKYQKWLKNIKSKAWMSIGKTTIKDKQKEKFSEEVDQLRGKKKELKKALKRGDNPDEYKRIQKELRHQILLERSTKINNQFKKMTQDKSRIFFWKERKRLKRNETNEYLTVKDNNGNRQFDPVTIMDTTATFYENLYSKTKTRPHEHHSAVKRELQEFKNDLTYDQEWYNMPPTENEVKTILENRKNNKASTDVKNEMLKYTKDQFTKILMPLIKEVWLHEQVPSDWKKGSITTIWKGKGDKERLENHRGITVSSAIGSVIQEIINNRIERVIKFSPSQAGGIKGAATCDHLFILRGIMTTAIAKKQNLFLTFFDVHKAYDHADVENMLHIMWKSGIRGRLWRILKDLSTNLKAVVKTRFGMSREIVRENGGLQGSNLTGRMFAKQMDTLSEDLADSHTQGVEVNDELNIGCLVWVDDVLSCTIGLKNQLKMLKTINDFACKSKLEWGEAKSQVMQIGKKIKVQEEWELGEKKIKNTTAYKYLGDTVTNDGKNKINLEIRENKITATIRQINTTASSDIMKRVETTVILTLYEKSVIPTLIHNCESWTLSITEENQIDKIGVKALKRLFNLPTTTPSVAILHNLGLLYLTQVVDNMRFMYLHKIVNRQTDHWTNKMIAHLKTQNIGWARNIQTKLTDYQLETDWNVIKQKTKGEWKNSVTEAVNKYNQAKLLNNCTTSTANDIKINTKTKNVYKELQSPDYKRQPTKEIIDRNKQKAKTVILARHGMLECGTNYKGTMPKNCKSCLIKDDENHRLNECTSFNETNWANSNEKIDFDTIYSNDNATLTCIIERLESVWEFQYANGRMKKS